MQKDKELHWSYFDLKSHNMSVFEIHELHNTLADYDENDVEIHLQTFTYIRLLDSVPELVVNGA